MYYVQVMVLSDFGSFVVWHGYRQWVWVDGSWTRLEIWDYGILKGQHWRKICAFLNEGFVFVL
jgi:hypothetical protein